MKHTILAAIITSVILTGCTGTTNGTPLRDPTAPTSTAVAAPSTTTSTTTTAAPAAMEPLTTPDAIFADIKAFWETSSAKVSTGVTLVSDPDAPTCSGGTFETATAAMCGNSDTGRVVYSEPRMTELMAQTHGDLAATIVLAHEYGHAIQRYTGAFKGGVSGPYTNGVKGIELSADCLAGVYVAGRGYDPREVSAALPLAPAIGENPTRVTAFHMGMSTDKPKTCLTRYQ
ncbi:neutral zinc metallopeptidase [Mycobacteroides abscessus]|uniref:neutral zinc metallopeptidase n=1 Tax=Mycobacteroides abscessus TaxID=36809 RepID=UPI0019CF93F0|nr:neutral zinc metallopeptidase [Mycobacteroides abscessus]MBN7457364.1 neutral zinc metallopeptidase [Mycobacteroides abscessus subsp. abscessus]